MSVLLTTEAGWIISHLEYIKEIYQDVDNEDDKFKFCFYEQIFDIHSQFLRDNQFSKAIGGVITENYNNGDIGKNCGKKRKKPFQVAPSFSREIEFVKGKFEEIWENVKDGTSSGVFLEKDGKSKNNNIEAREAANNFFKNTSEVLDVFFGANFKKHVAVEKVRGRDYVFPENCEFFSADVGDIGGKIEGREYDFVLMDPPWWNKFVRRKRERNRTAGYKMMYNDELLNIPIEKMLKATGVVAVWCSNAQSHYSDVIEKIFPNWGIKPVATWYWVKVTQSGQPICNFRCESVKQPYEIIIFGVKIANDQFLIPDKKLLISTPSSVHSHKPPLTKVIQQFLPDDPKCLEIFARYLLPNWTSYGLEVLKFQNLWLYN